MNFKIYTFGCKVNQYESEYIRQKIEDSGHTLTDSDNTAQIFIVNSCTVTAISESKCRRFLGRLRRNYPQSVILLCGCMPQAFPRKYENFESCDIVIGNTSRDCVPELINEYLAEKERIIRISEHDRKCGEFEPCQVRNFSERTRAFLKIEDGCDRFCSYCIIPYARGRVRSKPLEDIVNEVNLLSENGYKEIVLVGINLSKYGVDMGLSLCDAVEAVAASPLVERVRLGSLEPELLTEDILSRLAKCEKFCPQFHLSLQSGCDDTLKRMNRHYDSAEYMGIVSNIRRLFYNPSITTDVMVGFAGETEEEFSASLAFVKSVGFAKVHVFPYSRRKGTVADRLPEQLTKAEKDSRAKLMSEACDLSRQEFMASQVGAVTKVLIERPFDERFCEGYSLNYTPILLKGSKEELCHKCFNVKITEVRGDYCIAMVI